MTVEIQSDAPGRPGVVDRCTSRHIAVGILSWRALERRRAAHSGEYLKNHPPDRDWLHRPSLTPGQVYEQKGGPASGPGNDNAPGIYSIIPSGVGFQSSLCDLSPTEMLRETGRKLVKGEKPFRMACKWLLATLRSDQTSAVLSAAAPDRVGLVCSIARAFQRLRLTVMSFLVS